MYACVCVRACVNACVCLHAPIETPTPVCTYIIILHESRQEHTSRVSVLRTTRVGLLHCPR